MNIDLGQTRLQVRVLNQALRACENQASRVQCLLQYERKLVRNLCVKNYALWTKFSKSVKCVTSLTNFEFFKER